MRGDDLNFEINEDVEVIDVTRNAENIHDVAHVGAAKRDLIGETLRIRHVVSDFCEHARFEDGKARDDLRFSRYYSFTHNVYFSQHKKVKIKD